MSEDQMLCKVAALEAQVDDLRRQLAEKELIFRKLIKELRELIKGLEN